MKSNISLLIVAVWLAIALCSPFSLTAQNTPSHLNVAAKAIYSGNAVLIRWSPMDFETWKWGVTNGYDLERYTIVQNGVPLAAADYENSHVQLESRIKPLPENDWQSLAQTNDLAGVAAGCLYGDSLDLLPPGSTSIMTIQNKSKEAENRFGFSLFAADQDFNIAFMMGLAFEDKAVEANCKYAYFIKPYDPPSSIIVKLGFAQVKSDSVYVLLKPATLKGTPGDSTAILTWAKDNDRFTSYIVERSTNNGATFQALNNAPLIHAAPEGGDNSLAVYIDSLSANGVMYVYRVRGRSPFGLLSPPSDTIHITGRPGPLPVQISIDSVQEVTSGQLTVTWRFPTDMQSKITGFDVLCGPHPEGPFTKLNTALLSASTRSFVHTAPQALNYYVVSARDLNGYELNSFAALGQPNDTVAPPRPVITQGVSDASGIVTLSWARSTAPDVAGYQVFISNVATAEFAVISTALLNDTIFHYGLNLNTLSEDVYFSVRALDFRYNRSPMAVPVLVKRPDIIPPSAPFIKTVNATMTGVYFEWNLSSSNDVVRYEFQRQKIGSPGWTNIKVFTPAANLQAFTDSTASKRNWYRYRLIAIDEADNRGGSGAVKAKPINDGLRDPILNLTGSLTQFSAFAGATISWRYPKDVDLTGFQIYRGFDSLSIRSYRFFPAPPPTNSDIMFATSSGGSTSYTFLDQDMDFKIPIESTFSFFNSSSTVPNKSVPPPTSSTTTSQFTVPNPNLPKNQASQPNLIYYWVMAQFADGSTSPLAGFVLVSVP